MSVEDYQSFLATKRLDAPSYGRAVDADALNPNLFPFQRQLVQWALRKGRAALFANTGLGKTLMSLSWAEQAAERVLMLAPLAVARQTVREGEKFGIPVTYARSQEQAPAEGITITNYEMLDRFRPDTFPAVVLDESSILKAYDGKTKASLIAAFRQTPLRLCCTATPAPNDIQEIANHAEFLGVMTRPEMLASFFINDDKAGWRLKGHAKEPFYRWLASWGMSLNRPSDLGYLDEGYVLPPLVVTPLFIETDYRPEGQLFTLGLHGVAERAAVRRDTAAARTAASVALIEREPEEPWLVWCGLNDEANRMAKAIPGAVNVEGAASADDKAAALAGFAEGRFRVLVTKPGIAAHGMNFQHCARMLFVGMNDSFEQYYQAIRRCWRYGQTRVVNAYVVLSEPERCVYENVLRKEREAAAMSEQLVRHVADFERSELASLTAAKSYVPMVEMTLPDWMEDYR